MMRKTKRKYEPVSAGCVNLLDDDPASAHDSHRRSGTVAHDSHRRSGTVAHDSHRRSGTVAHDIEGEAVPEGVEAVVAGFVPNPTILLARTVAYGVVPVLHCHAYRYRRGQPIRIVKQFSGWELVK